MVKIEHFGIIILLVGLLPYFFALLTVEGEGKGSQYWKMGLIGACLIFIGLGLVMLGGCLE